MQFSPFLFKLRAPHNAICGLASFAHYSVLPDWLAWECFREGNGCSTFAEMHARIAAIRARIRYDERTGSEDIGCIQLVSPTFFPHGAWIPQPSDWRPRTQTPVKYDLTAGEGRRGSPVWHWRRRSRPPYRPRACHPRSSAIAVTATRTSSSHDSVRPRFVSPFSTRTPERVP